jgi:hypothetical protein
MQVRDELESSMDWIEKRAAQECKLDNAAPRLWAYLCDALNHAVKSYNKHYADPLNPVLFNLTPYSSVYIQATNTKGVQERTVRLVMESRSIEIVNRDVKFRLPIRIDDDTGDAMLSDGKDDLTIERASRYILEPMLDFGKVRQ